MFVIYAPLNAFEPSTEAGSARTDADETAASAGEVEEANSGALVGVAEVLEHLEITKSTVLERQQKKETSPWFYLQKKISFGCVKLSFCRLSFFLFWCLGLPSDLPVVNRLAQVAHLPAAKCRSPR